MNKNNKGEKVDHRNLSDPIEERKDFIEHLKKNAPVEETNPRDPGNTGPQTGVKK